MKKLYRFILSFILVLPCLVLFACNDNGTSGQDDDVNSYQIVAVSNNSNYGYVSGSGTYNENSLATIEAIAFDGYYFTSWSDGVTQNPREIVVTENINLVASFSPSTFSGDEIVFNGFNVSVKNGVIEHVGNGLYKVTATNNSFGYWKNDDNQLISTQKEFFLGSDITINKDTTFTAVDSLIGKGLLTFDIESDYENYLNIQQTNLSELETKNDFLDFVYFTIFNKDDFDYDGFGNTDSIQHDSYFIEMTFNENIPQLLTYDIVQLENGELIYCRPNKLEIQDFNVSILFATTSSTGFMLNVWFI